MYLVYFFQFDRLSFDKRMDVIKENFGNLFSVFLFLKVQYFYEYSDEDSDFNRSVSVDFSIIFTVFLNELLEEEDIDIFLDEEFIAEIFVFFDSFTFANKNLYGDSKSFSFKEI